MPVIQSYSTFRKQSKVVKTIDEDSVIEEIRKKIIIEQPLLIHKINEGKNKEILENEIKKEVDSHKNINKENVYKAIINFLFGYGILQDIILDEDISDIDFTRYNYCTIKRNGIRKIYPLKFKNKKEFRDFAKLMIIRNGGIIDENYNHSRVSDEKNRLRINVSISPRNVTGTSMQIRKHRFNPYTLKDLVNLNMLTEQQRYFFERSEKSLRYNILICGKGAAGKTTLLRAILMNNDPLNNYLVCEKDTELYLNKYPNFTIQRIKKEEFGGVTVDLNTLVTDGLTMSLDAYVVGEITGKEAYTLIKAGSTDHNIKTTIHSSSARNAPDRLITLSDTANLNLPVYTIKEVISQSIDIIVYMKGFKIKEILKLNSYDRNSDKFDFTDITERCEEL
ncbi:pilus assembly protein [Vallitalea longa]|uniref:Pilus assembly protein n=1 Tax=Vallitalea longa TaxID=2936439 RepID=A0A9W5YHD0_9FIRM|nr:ATPase, T2SS/T4P/T4SS family [Vallitalea longa]GKX32303.1 pilus assembly protein [Vallitalea longa]